MWSTVNICKGVPLHIQDRKNVYAATLCKSGIFPLYASSCWNVAEWGRQMVLHNFYRQLAPPLTLLPSQGYIPTGKTLHLPLLCVCFASILSKVVATLLNVFIWDRYSQKAGNSHAQAFKIPKKLTSSSLIYKLRHRLWYFFSHYRRHIRFLI